MSRAKRRRRQNQQAEPSSEPPPGEGSPARPARERDRPSNGSEGPAHPALADLDEQQMTALNEEVARYVRQSFDVDEADIEDAAQQAWLVLLERRAPSGIDDLEAFMTAVGWRHVREELRGPDTVSLDPEDSALAEPPTHDGPLEHVAQRARVARIAEGLQQLSDREHEAFALWFGENVSATEACERLGISRSAYFKRLKAAKEHLEAAAELEGYRFTRQQRQLLSDYVSGIATGRARVRAERLIAADPQAAAMARELRRTHEAAAAVLPALAASPHDGALSERLAAVADRLRDAVSGPAGRPEIAEIAGSPVLASGGARGAGAIGAGALAKAFGGLGVGKLALGCLGGGAIATVACVAAGVVPLPGSGDGRDADREVRPAGLSGAIDRTAHRLAVLEVASRETPESAQKPTASATPQNSPSREGAQPAAEQPTPTLEPSTPPEVQEFGVESAGVPVGGAPPDTNDSDGASASTVRQEFGP